MVSTVLAQSDMPPSSFDANGVAEHADATVAGATVRDAHAPDREAFWHIGEDLLAVASKTGIVLDANPAWMRVLGLTQAQLLGKSLAALVHPDDAGKTAQALARLDENNASAAFESKVLTASGVDRFFKWSASFVRGHIYLSARDVTEEHHRDLALHDSRDFARLALSAVNGVGVWTYDVATDRFFCDAAVSEVYGIDVIEAAGGIKRERFLANIHPDDRASLRATMAGGLIESGDLELEYRICHPDGSTRHVLSRGHTYFTADGVPWRRTGVGIDMTAQRRLEQQLRQSQKMDAVGHLTGGIAHDFNNMLQGVIGPLELVKRLVAQGRIDQLDRFIDMSTASAKRAAALTHRLLAFSRQQPLAAASVDVHQLIVSLEDLIRQSARENITMAIDGISVGAAGDDSPCVVRCDPNQLENAVVNLAINACDAMPDGGLLSITAAIEILDAKDAHMHGDARPGRYVCLTVSDTGVGIPKNVVDQVFEPFFTTKPLGQGTGLGLSMVYGFAGQSGGFVMLDSEENIGTAVRLYLPEDTTGHRVTVRPASPAQTVRDGKGEMILIVDDDETIRTLLDDVFTRSGYRTVTAIDGPSALTILRSDLVLDFLLTDVGLPGINGRQLADAARVVRPSLPILFTTGYAEVARSGEFLDDGMKMLPKPFAMDTALAYVRAMLDA